MSLWSSIAPTLRDIAKSVLESALSSAGQQSTQPSRRSQGPAKHRPSRPSGAPSAPPAGGYPGDHRGPFTMEYTPVDDDKADPGEVVWAWVPFEEDHSQGKDRPVLVVGRDGDWLLALPLTSKDHDLDAAQEARAGRHWLDIGSGAWDRSGRPSEVRLDRVLRLDPAGVRRIGARLDEGRFNAVAAAVRTGR